MNTSKYKWILYSIASVILITLCIQIYWNIKIYDSGKQQLQNDVQTSIDKAIDIYYTNLAKKNSLEYVQDSSKISGFLSLDTIFGMKDVKGNIKNFDLKIKGHSNDLSVQKFKSIDSTDPLYSYIEKHKLSSNKDSIFIMIDSLRQPFESLTSKIIISFSEDNLPLSNIDSLFQLELNSRNLGIDYGLSMDGPIHPGDSIRPDIIKNAELNTKTASPYFHFNSELVVHYSNITRTVLRKNMTSILLSLLLVLGVIACLLYLLKIIRHQKNLAEVKNDLINNITHEFKTPIATISAAMEGIQVFNDGQNSEKTIRYTKMADEQLIKLNSMVEKLLETALLDNENLPLDFERIDLVPFIQKIVKEKKQTCIEKSISFGSNTSSIEHNIDSFHFENTINNLIDNAIKYGGETIEISLVKSDSNLEIAITDSGRTLTDSDKVQIFEKFYRVPKGNTHDIKGYGIGLYYAKKIIEKHNGKIDLVLNSHTTFKIILPNGAKN